MNYIFYFFNIKKVFLNNYKKRSKLKTAENFDKNIIIYIKTIKKKILKTKTDRNDKNTTANKKKIDKQT